MRSGVVKDGLAAALTGALGLGGIAAPAAGQTPVRLTDAREKILVLRETWEFEVWEHAPPRELELPAGPDEASYARPESALAAWAAALVAGDEAWLERTLTAERWSERAAKPAEELAREGRFVKLLLADRRLVVTYRVEAGGVLLLELSSYERGSGDRLLTAFYPMRRDAAGWRVEVQPRSPFFDRLISEFDLAEDTLVVDEGFTVVTVKPQ